jgi:hypothetical protein
VFLDYTPIWPWSCFISEIIFPLILIVSFHCFIGYDNLFSFYSSLKQINSYFILHFLVAWQGFSDWGNHREDFLPAESLNRIFIHGACLVRHVFTKFRPCQRLRNRQNLNCIWPVSSPRFLRKVTASLLYLRFLWLSIPGLHPNHSVQNIWFLCLQSQSNWRRKL